MDHIDSAEASGLMDETIEKIISPLGRSSPVKWESRGSEGIRRIF